MKGVEGWMVGGGGEDFTRLAISSSPLEHFLFEFYMIPLIPLYLLGNVLSIVVH